MADALPDRSRIKGNPDGGAQPTQVSVCLSEYGIVLEMSTRAAVPFDERDETPEIGCMGVPALDMCGVGIPPLQNDLDLLALSDFRDANSFRKRLGAGLPVLGSSACMHSSMIATGAGGTG